MDTLSTFKSTTWYNIKERKLRVSNCSKYYEITLYIMKFLQIHPKSVLPQVPGPNILTQFPVGCQSDCCSKWPSLTKPRMSTHVSTDLLHRCGISYFFGVSESQCGPKCESRKNSTPTVKKIHNPHFLKSRISLKFQFILA